MKYEKAQNILPQNVIELIQQYIDGGYLYIPRKSNSRKTINIIRKGIFVSCTYVI